MEDGKGRGRKMSSIEEIDHGIVQGCKRRLREKVEGKVEGRG